MPSTTAIGRRAESLVAAHLEQQGFIILARNLRVGRDEVDLVALDGAVLVAIEVRARRARSLVPPLLSVPPAKQRRLKRSIRMLMARHQAREARVDVAIVVDGQIDYYEAALDFSET